MSLTIETVKEIFTQTRSGFSKAEVETVGRSWLSREISCSVIGSGNRNVMIIGGLSGGDIEISSFLVDLAHELDDCLTVNRRVSEFNVSALCNCNTLHFIPIVNPDGIMVHNVGIMQDNPFYGRVQKMICSSGDLSEWNANIRGTQLDGNFNYKWIDCKLRERNMRIFSGSPSGYFGEYPESELETSSVCSYCRKRPPDTVIEFRNGNKTEIIPCMSEKSAEKSMRASKLIYGYTGINVVENESVFSGSFSGWAASEFSCPSVIFNIEKNLSEQLKKSLKSAVLLFCAQ